METVTTLSSRICMRERLKFQQSFVELVEFRIRQLRDSGRGCTANNYACALHLLKEFMEYSTLPTVELNSNIMKDFQRYMIARNLSMNTISLYNRNLRAAYNYAIEEGIVEVNRNPFRKVFTGQEKTRKRALRKEVVKQLVEMPLPSTGKMNFVRDLFLFSIYTQGMPFVDLAHLTLNNLRGEQLVYKRHKTNQSLRIDLPDCAREIIRRYHEVDNDYLFPILWSSTQRKAVRYDTALRMYNKKLHMISVRLGLTHPLSSYVARHTWASLAKWNGINNMVISEAMGHSNLETTTIYLASLDPGIIADANNTVINSIMR